jgi:hypothetical protein
MHLFCDHAKIWIGSNRFTPGTSYTFLQLLDGHVWLLLRFAWARTAMNCYCSFFTACWWWSGRFGWHHQLFLPICSSLCYCPGLTHRPTHCWWLGQSAWLLSMQWTLWVVCLLEVQTWAHHWLHHGLADAYLPLVWFLETDQWHCHLYYHIPG